MAASSLDPENMPESDRQLGKAHGMDALGPSDTSDSGSDVQGGFRPIEEFSLGLDRGTSEDADSHFVPASSDTDDSTHTGATSTAGRDSGIDFGGDINVDRIDYIDEEEQADLASSDHGLPPLPRQDYSPRPEKSKSN